MIFLRGFIHCDPHPGNVFVRNGKEGVEIVMLDHGLYQVGLTGLLEQQELILSFSLTLSPSSN